MFNRRHGHNKSVQKLVAFILVATGFMIAPKSVLAVCPVCTVAVGAGLGLSRYFGIDDSIAGIWVGGLMVSLTLWMTDWLGKRKWKILKNLKTDTQTALSFLFWTLLTYPPLWLAGIIGHPLNTILGIDKLIFGSVIGGLAFAIGVSADKKVRKIRGKQLFNYQRVVFPVVSLAVFSLVLYYFGGYLYGLN